MSFYTKHVLESIINDYYESGIKKFTISEIRKDYKKKSGKELVYSLTKSYLDSIKVVNASLDSDILTYEVEGSGIEVENQGISRDSKLVWSSKLESRILEYENLLDSKIPYQLISLVFNVPSKKKIEYELDRYSNLVDVSIENEKITDEVLSYIQITLLIQKYETKKLSIDERVKNISNRLENISTDICAIISALEIQDRLIETDNHELNVLAQDIMTSELVTVKDYYLICDVARKKGVAQLELIFSLDSYDLRRFPSFKRVIDEVCEDGIITNLERVYLKEKSQDYNISSETIDRLIAQGLDKHKLLSKLEIAPRAEKCIKIHMLGRGLGFDFPNSEFFNHLTFDEKIDVDSYKDLSTKLLIAINKFIKSHYDYLFVDVDSILDFSSSLVDIIKMENKSVPNLGYWFEDIKEIILEEKFRIGTPEADLLAENILFRLFQKTESNESK